MRITVCSGACSSCYSLYELCFSAKYGSALSRTVHMRNGERIEQQTLRDFVLPEFGFTIRMHIAIEGG